MTPWPSPRRLARTLARLPQPSLLPGRPAAQMLPPQAFDGAAWCFISETPAAAVDERPVSEDLLRMLREAGL